MSGFNTWITSLCYGSIIAAASWPAVAQNAPQLLRDRAADRRPTLLVLGTGHFDNPGHDVVNTKVDDVLAPTRQAEINEVVEQLASFRPTHIAVEWPIKKQAALDARYRDFQAGKYRLGRGEEEQIGLRLAAKLHLASVYAVDWNEDSPGKDEDYDWVAYGQAHGQKAQVTAGYANHRELAAADQSAGNTCGESSHLLRLGRHWRCRASTWSQLGGSMVCTQSADLHEPGARDRGSARPDAGRLRVRTRVFAAAICDRVRRLPARRRGLRTERIKMSDAKHRSGEQVIHRY
jgi:hypothetical protein